MTDRVIESATRNSWSRTEHRVVRPFRDAAEYLRSAELRLTKSEEFSSAEQRSRSQIPSEGLEPAIRIALPDEFLAQSTGLGLEHLRLIVLLENRQFKTTAILHSERLNEFKQGVIELDGIARDPFSWTEDVDLHLAVVLDESRTRIPGTAYRRGSWLSKKTFTVTNSVNRSIFPITAVSKEFFQKRKLPSETLWFAVVLDDVNDPSVEPENAVKIFVREELVQALEPFPDSAISQALYGALVNDIVSMVAIQGIQACKGEITSGSLLDSVVSEISDGIQIGRQQLISQAQGADSEMQFRAAVQSYLGLSRVFVRAGGKNKR